MRNLILFCLILLSFSDSIQAIEFDFLNSMINKYKRPVTALALMGPDSDELMYALSAGHAEDVFVLWDRRSEVNLKLICSNIIHLGARISLERLRHLSESEHFDIVYVKKHYCIPDKNYINVLFNLGEIVYLHVSKDNIELLQQLYKSPFKALCVDEHGDFLFYSTHSKKYLKRTQWLEPASDSNAVRYIYSTLEEKILYKNYGNYPTKSVWLPGINLMTFKMLNGKIFDQAHLTGEIKRLFSVIHLDWMPNNMIIQGDKVALVDLEDSRSNEAKAVQDDHMLHLVINLALEPYNVRIPKRFEEILIYCRNKLHPKNMKRYFDDKMVALRKFSFF